MTQLTKEKAKKFFGSLYDSSHAPDLGQFEAAALRLVARVGGDEAVQTKDVAAGDKALAVLMLNQIMSTPKLDARNKAALTAAALLNIKSDLVRSVCRAFPDMTVDELKSRPMRGYHIEILPPAAASAVPRSVIGR